MPPLCCAYKQTSGTTREKCSSKEEQNPNQTTRTQDQLSSENMSESLQQHSEQPAVLCDMCTEEDRKPARKTCMKCEISMCVQHLQAHLTTPVLLQTHPLTEPLALGEAGATKCPQHGKVLEYYCLDDLTCVCVSCAIEDQHRLHNMKTISTAHKELMEKLGAEQQALATTAGKGESLEKWEKGERRKLAQSSVRLVEAVSKMRDLALSSVQSSVSARMVSIKTSESSIQAAQSEKDTFRFLRMFSGVHQDVEKAKAVDLRKGLDPGSDRDKLVQELRQDGYEMEQKAFQLWGSLLILVDPENHQEDFSTSEEVTFDPKSLRKGMSLSSDHRKVFYSRETSERRPAHTLLIQSDKSITNWMIRLPEDCDWTIGVCDKVSAKNLKDGHVYGLCCIGDQLSSLTTDDYEVFSATPNDEVNVGTLFRPQIQRSKNDRAEKKRRVSSQVIKAVGERGDEETSQPQQVEVLWNVPASSLSFFNRSAPHQRTEILTITTINASWDLSPFVNLGEGEASEEIVNLNQPQQSQQQCECLCGKVYRKNGNSYSCSNWGGANRESIWNTCTSCSGVVGEPPITEVLCELL